MENRSGEARWQAQRRAAMETAVSYWRAKYNIKTSSVTGAIKKTKSSNRKLSSCDSTSSSTSTSSCEDDEEEDIEQRHEGNTEEDSGDSGVDEVDKTEKLKVNGFVIWAGLEPTEFISIFPDWLKRDDVTEVNTQVTTEFILNPYIFLINVFFVLNLQDGRAPLTTPISQALSLLTQTEYPLDVLLARPLPEGVDPTRLELYLSDVDFETALAINRTEYAQLPSWKQTKLKKERGLF